MNGNSDLPLSASVLHISSDKNREASQCIFCDKKNHKSQLYKTVTDIVKRKKILNKKTRCFRCLKAGHLSKQCTSKITCHNCQGRHHLAVCETKYNVKSTSLQPNAPAFQPLQQQMSTIAPPSAPQITLPPHVLLALIPQRLPYYSQLSLLSIVYIVGYFLMVNLNLNIFHLVYLKN